MLSKPINLITLFLIFIVLIINGCGKNNAPATPVDPCASKTIVVGGTNTLTSTATATDATITATASGSTSFTYSKDGVNFQATGSFTGLATGNYTITAKDADGCKGTKTFTITSTPCPTITVTASITQASSPVATNGALNITATGGVAPYTYSKDNGASFQSSAAFANLAAANYAVVAKDANGCTGTASFTVTAASCATITLTATPTNATGPTSATGSIAVSATGGLAPYTYSKDAGTTFVTATSFTALVPGSYSIVAKDANGCKSAASAVTVSFTCPTLTLTSSATASDKCPSNANNGTVTLTASGSTGFTYSKDNVNFQASNIFTNLSAGSYTFTAKDLNGCTKTATQSVVVSTAGPLFLNVKNVLATSCAVSGCHVGASAQSGLDFTDDCTIAGQASRIKARAVDANPSVMPPTGAISSSEKQKIIDWINAGGTFKN